MKKICICTKNIKNDFFDIFCSVLKIEVSRTMCNFAA